MWTIFREKCGKAGVEGVVTDDEFEVVGGEESFGEVLDVRDWLRWRRRFQVER